MSSEKKLDEIVHFWKLLLNDWDRGGIVGQKHLSNFQQLYKLHIVRDLETNVEKALILIFEGYEKENKFEFEIDYDKNYHTRPPDRRHFSRFRWKLHPEWIRGAGATVLQATKSAASLAFIAILGRQMFYKMDLISSSNNYCGIGPQKLASQLYSEVGRQLIQLREFQPSDPNSTPNTAAPLPDPRLNNSNRNFITQSVAGMAATTSRIGGIRSNWNGGARSVVGTGTTSSHKNYNWNSRCTGAHSVVGTRPTTSWANDYWNNRYDGAHSVGTATSRVNNNWNNHYRGAQSVVGTATSRVHDGNDVWNNRNHGMQSIIGTGNTTSRVNDVLNFNAETFSRLPLKEKENIVVNFWASRFNPSETFPVIFNLLNEGRISRHGQHCFHLLFSKDRKVRKRLVKFEKDARNKQGTIRVRCSWTQDGKSMETFGDGKDYNVAANQAGLSAMKLALGRLEFLRLDQMSQDFIWKNLHMERIQSLISDKCRGFRSNNPSSSTSSQSNVDTASAPASDSRERLMPPAPPATVATIPNTTRVQQVNYSGVSQPPCAPVSVTNPMGNRNSNANSNHCSLDNSVRSPQAIGTATATTTGSSALPSANIEVPVTGCDDDNFKDFFSTSEDGTTLISQDLLDRIIGVDTTCSNSNQLDKQSVNYGPNGMSSTQSTTENVKKPTPYLPFDELIGMNFPDEAVHGLDVLFSGRDEDGPVYECQRYVLAECRLSSDLVFEGLGLTSEDAQNAAARKALEYLKSKDSLYSGGI